MERQHVVVMGVSGSGKSTVTGLLGQRLGWFVIEGDELHPPANIAKMVAGRPLDDADRLPWLQAIRDRMTMHERAGRDTVVACSALRRGYRDVLREVPGRVRFVQLTGTEELIAERLGLRAEHFMPAGLLGSQYAALEPLDADEDGIVVPVIDSPEKIVSEVIRRLRLSPGMP